MLVMVKMLGQHLGSNHCLGGECPPQTSVYVLINKPYLCICFNSGPQFMTQSESYITGFSTFTALDEIILCGEITETCVNVTTVKPSRRSLF